MVGEFADYKRAPGFWFYLELLVAADICAHPILSAKERGYGLLMGDIDYFLESGLNAYELLEERRGLRSGPHDKKQA